MKNFTAHSDDKWVYESPDGGETIYRRRLNDPLSGRILYKQNDAVIENELWRDIRKLAKTNETLHNALEEVKLLYKLISNE